MAPQLQAGEEVIDDEGTHIRQVSPYTASAGKHHLQSLLRDRSSVRKIQSLYIVIDSLCLYRGECPDYYVDNNESSDPTQRGEASMPWAQRPNGATFYR